MTGHSALPRPCLMLVTEPHPRLPEIVAAAVAGGVNVVQMRDKTAKQFELIATAQELRALIPPPNLLIVNGTYHAVARAGADGTQMSRAPGKSIAADSGRGLLGVSVHSVGEAQEAAYSGADYLVAGTVFASQSHPQITPPGVGFLRDVCRAVTIPVLAIGGVTPQNAAECLAAGAAGVAVLSPLMRAQDPEAAALAYRDALEAAWANRASPL